jgi:TetR/AcrR family transcriptional repressor of lmrAB and yxaGH operons
MARGDVRARMVSGAVRLLAEKGPPGASFGDVLEATGSPRGSTYHHFPGGKRELYVEALDLASGRARDYLEEVRGQSAEAVVKRFFTMWRELLARTDFRAGCAVLALTVAGNDEAVVEHAGRIFSTWREHLASLLREGGLPPERARVVAALAISAAEGAVAVARAEKNLETFDLVAREVARQIRV